MAIYPPIGIARAGNAPGDLDYVLASEVVGGVPAGDPRDANGHLKRQAVLFRVFATLDSGDIIELEAGSGVSIEWRVAVANLKAGWYAFENAMDLAPELAMSAHRRNRSATDRSSLDIVPPPVVIAGPSASGPAFRFEGSFLGTAVYLGEARTDAQGRLLFLGGKGAATVLPAGSAPTTFANNDGWCDDVSDGTVRASVTLAGRRFEAEPAHVVVTPPNFAPGLFGVVTMADVADETFEQAGWVGAPTDTSFQRDIWPIFDRMSGLQWVNHGLFIAHGAGSPLDARAPGVIARLADPSDAARAWRKRVFALFRNPATGGTLDRLELPYVYGDAYGDDFTAANAMLAVTEPMYRHLQAWSEGAFVSDWTGLPVPPAPDRLSPSERLHHLERAGLHECLGGPFHPGIELTWILRRASLWARPWRLRCAPEDAPTRQDYGPTLTPNICLGEGGPLGEAGPGSLTRWLGVPWHTDAASCNSAAEYVPTTYLSMPSFWGARVPNQVLSETSVARASDPALRPLQAAKHFADRVDWTRDINGTGYADRITAMTTEWWKLGLVQASGGAIPDNLHRLGLHTPLHAETGRLADAADAKPILIAMIEHLDQDPPAGVADAAPHKPDGKQFGEPRVRHHRGEI